MAKSSKTLIGILIALVVLIAIGAVAYFGFGISADTVTSGVPIACSTGKVDPNKLIIPIAGRQYTATKIKPLRSPEKAEPDGIYMRSAGYIYYTDGFKYVAKPDETTGIKIIKVGGFYYKGDIASRTELNGIVSSSGSTASTGGVIIPGAPKYYSYKDSLYSIPLTVQASGTGDLYQINSVTVFCVAKVAPIEIDIAGKAREILGEPAPSFSLKAYDQKTGKELLKVNSSTIVDAYDVSVGQVVEMRETWTPVIPDGVRTQVKFLKGSELVKVSSTSKIFTVIGTGAIEAQMILTPELGTSSSSTLKFVAGKG